MYVFNIFKESYGLRNSQRPHCRITARLCLASPISKHTSLHQVAGFGTKRVQTGLASTTTLLSDLEWSPVLAATGIRTLV